MTYNTSAPNSGGTANTTTVVSNTITTNTITVTGNANVTGTISTNSIVVNGNALVVNGAAVSAAVSMLPTPITTNLFSAWHTATGDGGFYAYAANNSALPINSVSYASNNSSIVGVTLNKLGSGGTWNNNWYLANTTSPSNTNYGSTANSYVCIFGAPSSIVLNISQLSAFGFFIQSNSTNNATYTVTAYNANNGTGTVLGNITTIGVNNAGAGAANGTGAVFVGYYGDTLGLVQSLSVQQVGNTASESAIGQFRFVAAGMTGAQIQTALLGDTNGPLSAVVPTAALNDAAYANPIETSIANGATQALYTNGWLYLYGSAIAAATLTFPVTTGLLEGQTCRVVFNQAISAITWTSLDSQTIIGAPTSAAAGTVLTFIWSFSIGSWVIWS